MDVIDLILMIFQGALGIIAFIFGLLGIILVGIIRITLNFVTVHKHREFYEKHTNKKTYFKIVDYFKKFL